MYLIIGASGFIGRHMYDYCKNNGIEVLGTYYSNTNNDEWIRFDICTDTLEFICCNYLNGRKPNAVIICGANANIDSCKKNADVSNQINISGTKRILMQAKHLGIKSVFLSSEAVFDGKRGMYTEEDIPNPITLYGSQKLQIEQFMLQNLEQFIIFRISRAVDSRYGEKDIFGEFYSKIKRQEEIICLRNQYFCLTEVNDISKCIVNSLEKGMNGLYHASSSNYLSRYELANLYAQKVFGGYDKIVEKDYNEISFIDNRHLYGGLVGDKLADLLGIQYMSTEQILEKYTNTIEEGRS